MITKPFFRFLFLCLSLVSVASALIKRQTNQFRVNLTSFYNVKGDTSTTPMDFGSIFATALKTVYDSGGGVLEINPGIYKSCNEVVLETQPNGPLGFPDNTEIPQITVQGSGGESQGTKIYCNGSFTGQSGQPAFFRFKRMVNDNSHIMTVTFKDLSIEGAEQSTTNNVYGIISEYQNEMTILENVHFRYLHTGIWLKNGRYHIDYCKFSNIRKYGIDGSGEGNYSGAGDGWVTKGEFAVIGLPNATESDTAAAIRLGGNVIVSGNIIFGSRYTAILVDPKKAGQLSIINNEFDHNRRIIVVGNKQGQVETEFTSNIEFSGNNVLGHNGLSGTPPGSVEIGLIKGSYFTGLHIKNNRFAGLAPAGIGFEIDNSDDIQITGNSFSPFWYGNYRAIAGLLFKFTNCRGLDISNNRFNLGITGYKPYIATFAASQGKFDNNQCGPDYLPRNDGTGNNYGVIESVDSRISYSGNQGWPSFASAYGDNNGWVTVPQTSRIMVPDYFGGAPLRQCEFAQRNPAVYNSGIAGRILSVKIPIPTGTNSSSIGARMKILVHTRVPSNEKNATYQLDVLISDYNLLVGGPGIVLQSSSKDDIFNYWSAPVISFGDGTSGSDYRVKTINFAATAPGSADYQVTVNVSYEEWGGIKLQ